MDLKFICPSLPKTERGKPLVLGRDPNGENVLYTNGNSVIILNLTDYVANDVYTQHSTQVNVAKYSPSRYYIASGDNSGKVRIWDTTQKEHILKAEYQPFSGPVKDIDWSDDNKRLMIGGQGRGKFGAAILVDTGASTGDIMGMSKQINSVAFKPNRPYRVVCGCEDNLVCYFEGPPFKYKNSFANHSNFVNSVRYSADGNCIVSGGADGKLFVYDGKTGDMIQECEKVHTGGVYAVEFSPKGKRLVSFSADKSIALWSVEESGLKPLDHYKFDSNMQNMILGGTWVEDKVIACSLAGFLHMFTAGEECESLGQPSRVICGHSKPIICSAFNTRLRRLVTGSMDGSLGVWEVDQPGDCRMITGPAAHTNQIQSVTSFGDFIATVGIDDRLVISSLNDHQFKESLKLDSQPRSVAYSSEAQLLVVCCLQQLYMFSLQSIEAVNLESHVKVPVSGDPDCVAINKAGTLVAIITESGELKFFATNGGSELNPLTCGDVKLKQKGTAIAFSPDDKYLATADVERVVSVFEIEQNTNSGDSDAISVKNVFGEMWRFHTARLTCLAWNPDCRRVASGSLDCGIIVWSMDNPRSRAHMPNAHPMSQITSLAWTDENTLYSTGQDASIRCWDVKKAS